LIEGQAASTFTFIRSSRFISLFKHMRFSSLHNKLYV